MVSLEINKSSGCKDEKALCKKKIREMNLNKADDFKAITVQHQSRPKRKENTCNSSLIRLLT